MRTFRSRFCQQLNCPVSEYEEQVLRDTLFGHARWLAAPLQLLSPNFFAEDRRFIALLGETTSLREAHAEAGKFHFIYKRKFLRNALKLRVSGKKTVKLAQQLFAQHYV